MKCKFPIEVPERISDPTIPISSDIHDELTDPRYDIQIRITPQMRLKF